MNNPIGITTKSLWSLDKATKEALNQFGASIIKMEYDKPNKVLLVWVNTSA